MNGLSDYYVLSQILSRRSPDAQSLIELEKNLPIEIARQGLIIDLPRSIYMYSLSINRDRRSRMADLVRLILRDAAWRAISRKMFGDAQSGDATTLVNSVMRTLKCAGCVLEEPTHDYVWHKVAGLDYATYLLTEEIMNNGGLSNESVINSLTIAINAIKGELGNFIDKIVKGKNSKKPIAPGISKRYFLRMLMYARNQLRQDEYPGIYGLSPSSMFVTRSRLNEEECKSNMRIAISSYINYSDTVITMAVGAEEAEKMILLVNSISDALWSKSIEPRVVIPIILMLIEPHHPLLPERQRSKKHRAKPKRGIRKTRSINAGY